MSDFEDMRREEREAKERGRVWRDDQGRPAELRKVRAGDLDTGGPDRHPPLEGAVRSLSEEAYRTFSSLPAFRNRSYDQWEAGFRKDARPWNEIYYWVRAARAFRRLTEGQDLDTDQLADVFRVIMAAVVGHSSEEIAKRLPRTVSNKKLQRILEELDAKGQLTAAEVAALAAYREQRTPEVREALRAEGASVGNLFELPPPWEGDI